MASRAVGCSPHLMPSRAGETPCSGTPDWSSASSQPSLPIPLGCHPPGHLCTPTVLWEDVVVGLPGTPCWAGLGLWDPLGLGFFVPRSHLYPSS